MGKPNLSKKSRDHHKTFFIREIKLRDNCQECGNELGKKNKHHFLCDNCWEKRQLKKGNLSLIGGIK